MRYLESKETDKKKETWLVVPLWHQDLHDDGEKIDQMTKDCNFKQEEENLYG